MRRRSIALLAGLLATPAHAQLLTRHDLSYAMAKTIAEGALESCGAKGYPVAVVVLDRGGEILVMLRADGASAASLENARRKAYTALTYHTPTSEYAKRYASGNPVIHQQVTLPGIIAIPGGLPIKAGTEQVGAAGVSGSPGVDEPCTQAGIDKVADQLK